MKIIHLILLITVKGIEIMKSTGIVRRIDGLGRVVLPIELRRVFDLDIGDSVEIYTEEDKIILRKFQRSCVFCGSSEDLVEHKGKTICSKCLEELRSGK